MPVIVEASFARIKLPPTLIDAVEDEKFCCTATSLITSELVMAVAAVEPTCRSDAGLVVPMPTLPPLVILIRSKTEAPVLKLK